MPYLYGQVSVPSQVSSLARPDAMRLRLALAMWVALMVARATGQDVDPFGGLPGGTAAPAEPAAAEPATLNGLWLHRAPEGRTESLAIYARSRFGYRDTDGAAAAGRVEVGRRLLVLQQGGVRRVFIYELAGDVLRLTPDSSDHPVELGDLARLSPRGSQIAVYTRRGRVPSATLPFAEAADLVGRWTFGRAGAIETLDLRLDHRFHYQGRGDISARGEYAFSDGQLELVGPASRRRLEAALDLSAAGWTLTLRRDPAEPLNAGDDLADLPPALRDTAVWRRPLDALAAADLQGVWESETSPAVQLVFEPAGQARLGGKDGRLTPAVYEIQGALVTLRVGAAFGELEERTLLVQRVPGGLVITQPETSAVPGGVLGALPPTTGPAARYRRR